MLRRRAAKDQELCGGRWSSIPNSQPTVSIFNNTPISRASRRHSRYRLQTEYRIHDGLIKRLGNLRHIQSTYTLLMYDASVPLRDSFQSTEYLQYRMLRMNECSLSYLRLPAQWNIESGFRAASNASSRVDLQNIQLCFSSCWSRILKQWSLTDNT